MPASNQFSSRVATTTITIANGETTSTVANLHGTDLIKIVVPAEFTGVVLTIQASYDGGTTWATVEDAGVIYSLTVRGSRTLPSALALKLAVTVAMPLIRVVSGSSEAGARTLTLVSRPI